LKRLFNSEALQSLRVRDFRLYWTGNTLSRLGNEMQIVALAWQVYLLTGEPLSLGLLGLVRAGPVMLFTIFGGVLADSMSRRRLLIITSSALMLTSALLAVLTISGVVTIWMLYVLTFLAAIAESVDGPAHAAVIPSLVPREMLLNGLGINNLSWSMAGIIGPALGGLVIGWFGAGVAFAIDAASFLAVIWVFISVRRPLFAPELSAEERSLKGNLRRIRQGFSFLYLHPILLGLSLVDFFAVLFGASLTLLPVFAKDVLKVGPEGLGLLAAAPAVGAVAGAMGVTFLRRPRFPGQVVLVAIFFYGLCVAGFGLSTVFWLSWLFLAGTGVSDTVSMTMRQTIRQLLTPEEMRGRISGVSFFFAVSGNQLGDFEAGVAAQLIGAQPAVALGGLACALMVVGVGTLYPRIRKFTEKTEVALPVAD
jgi:MFS family permease